ncbi:MAG: helix-turn-helix domain-containing protein, partial [Parabacteroides sp.]|nr:helix-turn-helix domain-containing protein [Parabacteroides sp.]
MAQVNVTERHQLSSQKFFTIQDAADYLRISKRSMYRLIQRGEIITVKIMSRMTRITLD